MNTDETCRMLKVDEGVEYLVSTKRTRLKDQNYGKKNQEKTQTLEKALVDQTTASKKKTGT